MSSGITGSLASSAPSLLQVRETGMLQQLNQDGKTDDKGRIEKAAEQFEAMLLGTWLKEAEKSFSTLPGSGDDSTEQQVMSLGVQSLSQAMAASGGIGIGKMIAQAMEAAAAKQAPGTREGGSAPVNNSGGKG
jgi:Rod binding domain-containing protein